AASTFIVFSLALFWSDLSFTLILLACPRSLDVYTTYRTTFCWTELNRLPSKRGRMHTTQRLSVFEGQRLVPLAAPTDEAQTATLRRGLVNGGLNIVEIGLRTTYSMTAWSELAAERDVLVGAGTIMDAAQAKEALAAGARFLVSPGFAGDVLDTA